MDIKNKKNTFLVLFNHGQCLNRLLIYWLYFAQGFIVVKVNDLTAFTLVEATKKHGQNLRIPSIPHP